MELSVSSISLQLDSIVASHAISSSVRPAGSSSTAPSRVELRALDQARAMGQEKQYLEGEVSKVNELVRSVDAPVKFAVEISGTGDYFVRVYDAAGKEVKTIPTETFVETRERIHAEVKGLIEDSQS
jgi:uncharacterized FlaG/YvyC family protein